MVFAATPPYHGTLARYYKVPSDLVYPLPENLSLEEGAMMEPLSVGIHSVHTIANVRANQTVIVFGAGPVGLLCMAVARALGARRVIAVDIVQSRLEFALQYAATHIYLPGKPNEGEKRIEHSERIAKDMREKLGLELIGRNAVDTIIDATGAPSCIQLGVLLVKAGGIFVQVGMGPSEAEFPVTQLIVKQVRYEGSFRYGPGDYETAIALVASGRIDVKPLITHRYKFDDALKAFEVTRSGKSEDGKAAIKVIIDGPE
jgi:D-xylulose reductase